MMTCINVEKDHSMIETRRLENVVIFIQTILCFVLSRKNINMKNSFLFLSKNCF